MNRTTSKSVLLTAACIASLGAAPVRAQSTVTVYGVVDQVLETTRGVNAGNGVSARQTRLGLGATPSRLGFRGSEDLGGGLRAFFTLEQGLSPDTGTLGQGSRVFGRQAAVGLTGDFGSVALGRLYAMRYFALLDADIFGAGSQGLGTLDNGIPNARIDNAISWRGGVGAWSGGLSYSLGRDGVSGNNPAATGCAGESTDSKQCREWSVLSKYDGGNWGLVGAYERQYGGTSTTYGGLTSPQLSDSRATVNAYLKLPGTRLGLGWLGRDNEGSTTPKSNLLWLVGEYTLSQPVVLTGMLAQIKFKDSPNKASLLALKAGYWFSKRTTVYVSDEFIDNHGSLALAASANSPGTGPLPGHSQNSLQIGVGHTF